MKHFKVPTTSVSVGLLLLLMGPLASSYGQLPPFIYLWQGTSTNTTFEPANDWWNDTANWQFGQEPWASFGEVGQINNNTVAIVNRARNGATDASEAQDAGGVILGTANDMDGTLIIANGGVLVFVTAGNTTNFADGAVQVGTGAGRGTLIVQGNGSLTSTHIIQAGETISATVPGSEITLRDTAVVNTGSAIFGRTIRTVGPSVNFSATDTLQFTGRLVPEITHATNHSALKTTGDAYLSGTFRPEMTGVTPAVGNTWNIIDAAKILGDFNTVDFSELPALGNAQTYGTRLVNGGTNGRLLQLSVEQLLTLQVNRATGAVTMRNTGTTPVAITGYTVSSDLGTLGGTWTSFQDAGQANWVETIDTASEKTELNSASGGSRSFAGGGTPVGIGTPFSTASVIAGLPFGQSPEDVEFEFTTSTGQLLTGVVEYTGVGVQNNLIITVNPTNGDITLKNDSPHTIALDGYSILSESGQLRQGMFNGLRDTDSGWDAANLTANALSELKHTDGGLTLAGNSTRTLGAAFTPSGTQDLELEFILFGENSFRNGGVVYSSAVVVGVPGDYNNNGIVDAADYTIWRDLLGTNTALQNEGAGVTPGMVTQEDYNFWKAAFGNTSGSGAALGAVAGAVPEPASAVLVLLALLAVGSQRPGRKQ